MDQRPCWKDVQIVEKSKSDIYCSLQVVRQVRCRDRSSPIRNKASIMHMFNL